MELAFVSQVMQHKIALSPRALQIALEMVFASTGCASVIPVSLASTVPKLSALMAVTEMANA
jgi:hypothetical protein